MYILARNDYNKSAECAVVVYNLDGERVADIPIEHWGTQGVLLSGTSHRDNVRVSPDGDIYVATATRPDGYRIEKYSWNKQRGSQTVSSWPR